MGKSPCFASSLKYGATEFHPCYGMWMPVGRDTPINEYWNAVERIIAYGFFVDSRRLVETGTFL